MDFDIRTSTQYMELTPHTSYSNGLMTNMSPDTIYEYMEMSYPSSTHRFVSFDTEQRVFAIAITADNVAE